MNNNDPADHPESQQEQLATNQKALNEIQHEIRMRQEKIQSLELDNLRLRVQIRAFELKRQDILTQLVTAPVAQLEQWLAEMN
jgi:hypothetical protein